jgi:phosphatidylglycerophosphate synthase
MSLAQLKQYLKIVKNNMTLGRLFLVVFNCAIFHYFVHQYQVTHSYRYLIYLFLIIGPICALYQEIVDLLDGRQ